jgi:hypothetical protein
MPTSTQVADALRAMAELVEFFDRTNGVPVTELVAWKSGGQAARIVAALDGHATEEYDSPSGHTRYLIHRGKLLGLPIEVMESQDD